MNILKLSENDLNDIVLIHLNAFEGFFLSDLGESFLELYYKSLLNEKRGIGIGVKDNNGKLIGFAVGASLSESFNKRMILHNLFHFSLIGIKLLLHRHKALIRLIKNLKKEKKGTSDEFNSGELFSIAIDSSSQGKGVGKILINEFEKTAKEKGCTQISLTTDYTDNADVVNFYLTSGYVIVYDFVTYPERKMYKMIKTI